MEWIWWVVLAFFGGGFLGMLVLALMHTASDPPKRSRYVPEFEPTRW